MEKVLVTGGGGFIGLAIVKELAAFDVQVTVIGRNSYPEAEKYGARCLQGDISDQEFVMGAVAKHDTVFHVAAKAGIWGSFESYYDTNVTGTKNVVKACLHNQVQRLIYTSTPSVVFNRGDLEGENESLSYADNVLCHYAATKIMAEKIVLQSNSKKMKTTALRPHLVWGPGDTNLIPRLLARGRERSLRMVGNGSNLVDISYIDNVAHAHILAAHNLEKSGSAAGLTFFISQGEPVVLWDWINSLFASLDVPQVSSRVPFRFAYTMGWILESIYSLTGINKEPKMTRFLAEQLAKSHWFSINRAEKILGYSPLVSTTEGMDRLIHWIGEQKK